MSRWTDEELKTIKDVFNDENFVLGVRNIMLGFSNKFEYKTTDKVIEILRKNLLPEYDPSVNLGEQQDLCYLSLNHITGFNAEEGIKRIEAFDLAIDYVQRRFKVLLGEEDIGEPMNDLKAKAKDNRFVRMLAYLQLGNYIEKSLMQLVEIAKAKELTPKELEERRKKNSAK